MEPRINPSFQVSVRPWVWTLGEFVIGVVLMATVLVGLRPLCQLLFGRPIVAPIMNVLLAFCSGIAVLVGLLSWRLATDDRDEYAYLAWRRVFSRRGAYNALLPHNKHCPLIREKHL